MADMSSETEKQLKWLESMYEKIRDIIAKKIKDLIAFIFKLIGKGLGKGGKELYSRTKAVGQRKEDKKIESSFSYDIAKEFNKSMNQVGVDYNYSFVVNDEIINPKDKRFVEINEEFKKVCNAKEYSEIKMDELNKMNDSMSNWKNDFKNKIKGESPENQKILLDTLNYSAKDIRQYEEDPSKSEISSEEMQLMEDYGVKKYLNDKEARDDLQHDIELSQSLSDLKEHITLEKVSDDFDFQDNIKLVQQRYSSAEQKVKDLSNDLTNAKENGTSQEEINEIEQELALYENDPIYQGLKDMNNDDRNSLFNEVTYTENENLKYASKENMKELLVEEYKYGAQQYRDESFFQKENETYVNNVKEKTKFMEKYNFMPKDLRTDNSKTLIEYKDTIHDLNGKPIEGAKGGTFDIVSNQKNVVVMTYLDRKITPETYNYAIVEAQNKAGKIQRRDEQLSMEENPQRPNETKDELENSLMNAGLAQEVKGNISTYKDFAERYEEYGESDNAIVQFQIDSKNSDSINQISNYLKSQNDKNSKTIPYMIENSNGGAKGGPLSEKNDFVITMSYSAAKKVLDEVKRTTGKDVPVKRGRVVSKSNIEKLDKQTSNDIIENSEKPMAMQFKDCNNAAILMSAGYAINNDNPKNSTCISIEGRNDNDSDETKFVIYSEKVDDKSSQTPSVENPTFVDRLINDYRDQIKYNDMGSVDRNLAFCKEETPARNQRNVQKTSYDKDKKEHKIEGNDRDLTCLAYDKSTKRFARNENDEYIMVDIKDETPIDTKDLSEGSYILVPYQERLKDEDKTLQAMELNPSIGKVEDELEEGSPEMYITQGYSLQVEATENVDENEKGKDTKTVEISNDDKSNDDEELEK